MWRCLVVLAACSAAQPATTATPAKPPPEWPPPRTCTGDGPGLRAVDWCNRVYAKLDVGADDIEVVGGEHWLHAYVCKGAEHVTDNFHVNRPAFGDVDGDGQDDAIVPIDEDWVPCDRAATDHTSHLLVFTLRGEQAVELARGLVPRLDDRELATGPDITVSAGIVIRSYRTRGGRAGVDRWRVSAGKLEPIK